MNELDNAIFCETHNRMNDVSRRAKERDNAYAILKNMANMLKEYGRENRDLPIPYTGRVSRKIQDRYGIEYDSEFHPLWIVLERLCAGEYELKQKSDVQPIK